MPRTKNPDAPVIAKRRDGLTYPEIGEKFGIHPSRAHQICKKAGLVQKVEVLPGTPVTGA